MPTINVRHRSASSSLDASVWELEPDTGSLVVFVRFGGAKPVGCTLSVCSERRRKVGGLNLSRIDESTWKVMPARWRFGGGFWSTVTSAFDADALLPLWPMYLSHCPVSEALALGAL